MTPAGLHAPLPPPTWEDVVYPDSDGKPMSDNTLQFEWIVMLHFGFLSQYASDPNVFVASDLLWYPVQGDPKTRAAPDVMVVFGRTKGHRGSYKQWEEEGVPPQVVIEVLSPGNTAREMIDKFHFYDRHGVDEYYIYDPNEGRFDGYLRSSGHLQAVPYTSGWTGPRTGVRFDMSPEGLLLPFQADGEAFESYLELRQRAAAEHLRAEVEKQRAETEKQRADRLAARMRELGLDPDAV